MRGALLVLTFAAWAFSNAAAESALDALSHLPKNEAAHLARIEGRFGSPEPDRWYFLVYDGTSETGVHEYVVAHGKVVASRTLSQFADSLTPEDVIDASAIKTDSAELAKLGTAYAGANGVTIANTNFELKKSADGSPAWKLSCLDATGASLGEITLSAAKGSVISHEGFANSPDETPAAPKTTHAVKAPKFDVYTQPVVTPDEVPSPSPEREGVAARRRRHPVKQEGGIGGAFKNFGHKVQHFFTF